MRDVRRWSRPYLLPRRREWRIAIIAPGRQGASMDRETAVALVRAKIDKDITFRHLISVEGVMRRLAQHFGENEHAWGLTGMFHDLDQDHTAGDAERHARLAAEWLREAGAPGDV